MGRYFAPLTTPSCAEQPETDPACSIRAQIVYDTKLMRRYRRAATPRDRWAFTLAAYNGGPGWISREKRRCQRAPGCAPARWFGHVERHCLRAAWACRREPRLPDPDSGAGWGKLMEWVLELSESMQGWMLFSAFLVLYGLFKLVALWIERRHPNPR